MLFASRERLTRGAEGVGFEPTVGLPHARFRVECLKPDSATLPLARRKRRTPNVEAFDIGNATVLKIGVRAFGIALDVGALLFERIA